MPDDRDRLLVLACRTAAQIIRNPVLAEEAGERAFFRYRLLDMPGWVKDRLWL